MLAILGASLAAPANNCESVSKKVCFFNGDEMVFLQSSASGMTIAMYLKNRKTQTLQVKCHSDSVLDLNSMKALDFSDVKYLDIQRCHIPNETFLSKIKEKFMLRTIESLTVDCTRNLNVSITQQTFESFAEVSSLSIFASANVSFAENSFVNFKNLRNLRMHVDDVTSLPRKLFKTLEKLETLQIENSGRAQHDTRALNFSFTTCINMQKFHISGVVWPLRISKILAHMHRLKSVAIINNRIESLSENAFKGSTEIETLNLTNNMITSLPARVFASQTDLVQLDLSHNELDSLEDDLFDENKDLEIIDLSHNKFSSISR